MNGTDTYHSLFWGGRERNETRTGEHRELQPFLKYFVSVKGKIGSKYGKHYQHLGSGYTNVHGIRLQAFMNI